jgi:DNA-binding transcriptional MerR regulator
MPLDLGEVLPEGKLYYRIGEVSKITGVKAYVLRYWESEFRWMAPQKSRSKQRLYRRKDIETILLIRRLLYEERYTIAGARLRLRDLGSGKASSTGKSGKSGTSGDSSSPAATPERGSEAGVDAASWAAAQADYRGRFQRIKQELAAIRASL